MLLRDVDKINKTLSHIKSDWHDEILATVKDSQLNVSADPAMYNVQCCACKYVGVRAVHPKTHMAYA